MPLWAMAVAGALYAQTSQDVPHKLHIEPSSSTLEPVLLVHSEPSLG